MGLNRAGTTTNLSRVKSMAKIAICWPPVWSQSQSRRHTY